MNPANSLRLFQDFQNLNIDYSKPIKPQLGSFFIPCFWNGNLVSRSSLFGRFITFLERPSEVSSNKKKVESVFAEAIKCLLQSKIDIQNLDNDLFIKLNEELEESYGNLCENQSETPEELAFLTKQKAECNATYWKEVRSLSLLHKPHACKAVSVDLQTLKEISTVNAATNPSCAFSYLSSFFTNNPFFAVHNWKKKLDRIKQACGFEQEVLSSFNELIKKTAKEEEKTELLQKASFKMLRAVHALDSSKEEKKIFNFSFGPLSPSAASFSELMGEIPEGLDALKSIQDLSGKNELHNMEMIGEKIIHSFFQNLIPKGGNTKSPLQEDPERQLPQVVAEKLPRIFEIWIEHVLKRGVIENICDVIPEGQFKDVIEIIKNGCLIYTLQDKDYANKIEGDLIRIFKKKISEFKLEYSQALSNLFKASQAAIPPQVMELFGVDHMASSGPIWLEFEKLADKSYNVTVYTLGKGVNFHPIDLETGKTYAVLRLKNVKADSLNQDFFFNLLKRHTSSLENPTEASTAFDIYSGPLHTLIKDASTSLEKNLPNDPKGVDSLPPTSWHLALTLLMRQNVPSADAKLQFYFQAVLSYCLPLMRHGKLEIPDIQACETLKTILAKIDSEFAEANISEQQKKIIKATCKEIRKGIYQRYVSEGKHPLQLYAFNSDIRSIARDFIGRFNVSPETLEAFRGTLSYFFGEEVGEFTNQVLDQSTVFLKKHPDPAINKPGILDSYYMTSYGQMVRHAAKLAAIGFGLSHGGWMHLLAFGGFWYLLPVPVVDYIIAYLLPPAVFEGYTRLKEAVIRTSYNIAVAATIKAVPKQIVSKIQDAKGLVNKLTNAMKGHPIQDPKANSAPRGRIEIYKAAAQKFPGFEIAAFQKVPELDGVPSYLVIENKEGAKKVLIPKQQLIHTLFGQFAPATGPFSELLKEAASKTQVQHNDYNTFDLKNGLIEANDIEGALYAICLYFLHRNQKALEKTLRHFEWLCSIKIFPESALLNLTQLAFSALLNLANLAIPLDIVKLQHIRRRIFAIISQNHFRFNEEHKSKDQRIIGQRMFLGLVSLIDLSQYLLNKNSQEQLTLQEEYFLFKFAYENLSVLLRGKKTTHTLPENRSMEILVELFMADGVLSRRYTELKNTFGITDSWKLWASKQIAGINGTTSSLPAELNQAKNISESPLGEQGQFNQNLAALTTHLRRLLSTSLKHLKLQSLCNEMDVDEKALVTLSPSLISLKDLKKQFLAYYAIARGERGPDKKEKLKHALKMMRGMGDKQCKVLLQLLETACLYSDKCPDSSEFSKYLSQKKMNEWRDCFKKVLNVAFGKGLEQEVLNPAFQYCFKEYGAHAFTKVLFSPFANPLFPPGIAQFIVDAAGTAAKYFVRDQIGTTLKSRFKHFPSPSEKIVQELPNYIDSNGMSKIPKLKPMPREKVVSLGCRAILPYGVLFGSSLALSYYMPSSQMTSVQSISYQCLSLVSAAFLRVAMAKAMNKKLTFRNVLPFSPVLIDLVNLSITYGNKVYNYYKPGFGALIPSYVNFLTTLGESYQEYHERVHISYAHLKDRDKECMDFLIDLNRRSKEAPSINIYREIKQQRAKLIQQKKSDLKILLDLFNLPYKFGLHDSIPLTLKGIQKLLDRGNIDEECREKGLSSKDIARIDIAIARINLLKMRIKQLDRLSALAVEENHDVMMNELKSFAEADFAAIPEEDLKIYLRHQAASKSQLVPYNNFLQLPIYRAFDKGILQKINPWIEKSSDEVHRELFNIYGYHAHHMQFDRNAPITLKGLHAIIVALKSGLISNNPLLFSYIDLQHLQSTFIERMYRYTHFKNEQTVENKRCLIKLKQILNVMKAVNIDTKPLKTSEQLVYPIKGPMYIPENYVNITVACVQALLQEAKDISNLSVDDYQTTVKAKIAERLSRYHRFGIDNSNKRKEFADFVCGGTSQKIPAWIENDDRLFSEISLVKGILHHMLPIKLGKQNLNANMLIPFESLLNQCLDIAQKGMTMQQGSDLAQALLRVANEQMTTFGITFEQTYVYKKFGPSIKIPVGDSLKTLISNPEAIFFYMREVISKKCIYWERLIQNTPKDFDSMFQTPALEDKQKVLDQILGMPDNSFSSWMAVFRHHEDDLLDQTEDDPANLFGYTTFEASQPWFVNPLVNMGIAQKIELAQDQTSLKPQAKPAKVYKAPPAYTTTYTHQSWPPISDPLELDWLVFSKPNPSTISKLWSKNALCRFYKVQDLLFETGSDPLHKTAFRFDNRLWMSQNFLHGSMNEIGGAGQAKLDTVLVHMDTKHEITGMAPLTNQEAANWKEVLNKKNSTSAFLWKVNENRCIAGKCDHLPKDFDTLVGQLKFLNGDVQGYSMKPMKSWLQNNDPHALMASFEDIHRRRGLAPVEGKDIDHLFIDVCGLPYEEMI